MVEELGHLSIAITDAWEGRQGAQFTVCHKALIVGNLRRSIIAFTWAADRDSVAAVSMKRFTWLLIAALCTAFASVQPVERLSPKACCCADHGCQGSCGKTGCACPALPAPALFASDKPAGAASVAAARRSLPAPAPDVRFFDVLVCSAAEKAGTTTPATAARAASAPLFKAYCSLLI